MTTEEKEGQEFSGEDSKEKSFVGRCGQEQVGRIQERPGENHIR